MTTTKYEKILLKNKITKYQTKKKKKHTFSKIYQSHINILLNEVVMAGFYFLLMAMSFGKFLIFVDD